MTIFRKKPDKNKPFRFNILIFPFNKRKKTMKTTCYLPIIFSLLFVFIFFNGTCAAQMAGKTKQDNKTEVSSDVQNIKDVQVSEKYIKRVRSRSKGRGLKWNEDQIQCAALNLFSNLLKHRKYSKNALFL
jgi:PBP1b-binding outer membrane lipoprotein LpoB